MKRAWTFSPDIFHFLQLPTRVWVCLSKKNFGGASSFKLDCEISRNKKFVTFRIEIYESLFFVRIFFDVTKGQKIPTTTNNRIFPPSPAHFSHPQCLKLKVESIWNSTTTRKSYRIITKIKQIKVLQIFGFKQLDSLRHRPINCANKKSCVITCHEELLTINFRWAEIRFNFSFIAALFSLQAKSSRVN